MAEIIQANLRQVGVQVTLVGEERAAFTPASAKAASA
jgi:ABC-type transport system substrate-binding protein